MTIEQALQLIIVLTQQIQSIRSLITKARAEGRDITDAELDELTGRDDAARKRLQDLIDKHS